MKTLYCEKKKGGEELNQTWIHKYLESSRVIRSVNIVTIKKFNMSHFDLYEINKDFIKILYRNKIQSVNT